MAQRAAGTLSRIGRFPFYPFAFAVAFLVSELGGQWVPAAGLIRPLVVLSLGLAVIQLGVMRLIGTHQAALLGAAVVIGAVNAGVAAFILLVAAAPLLWSIVKRRRVVALDWRGATVALNVLSAASLAVSGFDVARIAAATPAGTPYRPSQQESPARDSLPDIYLILLDMYPRADVLDKVLGFDNEPFESEMEGLGFSVSSGAHSNYSRTVLTLPSILNSAHLDDLMPMPPAMIWEQHRYISSFVNTARSVGDARALGYEFVVIPSEIEFITPDTADVFLDGGQLSKLETLLTRNGYLGFFEEQAHALYRSSHRDRVLHGFDALQSLSSGSTPSPRLVFAHLMLPHDPIAFRRDGSEAVVGECYWDGCDLSTPLAAHVRDALAEQIEFANLRVLETVRVILDRSERPPVIVVFSDHGLRQSANDVGEAFRTLFVALTPGRRDVFPDDATPVNLIPRLMNAYAGSNLSLAEEAVWYTIAPDGDQTGYFPLTKWIEEPPP